MDKAKMPDMNANERTIIVAGMVHKGWKLIKKYKWFNLWQKRVPFMGYGQKQPSFIRECFWKGHLPEEQNNYEQVIMRIDE